MATMTANYAKTHFGDMLLKVQKEAIEIKRHDQVVAVVLSKEEYDVVEKFKIEYLETCIAEAMEEVASGDLMDGDYFFDKVLYPK
jgi:PHD/YefM family antitoxin component YafN of YafNO toxin-antitoxin module